MKNPTGIRLVRPVLQVQGNDWHRHGWPWVIGQLQQLESAAPIDNTLLFDDDIEQTFLKGEPQTYNQPWAGIFHEPPDIPDWLGNYPNTHDALFKMPEFRRSLPYMRCAFTLSEYLARALRKRLTSCPVYALHYPSPSSVNWSPDNFRRNPNPALLQFGCHMRNTHILLQVPSCTLRRVRYLPVDVNWVRWWDNMVGQYWQHMRTRRYYRGADTKPLLSNKDYDQALSSNIIINEMFAASGNTVVVECIARATPLLINRHPAVVEYLGGEYPFYFKTPAEIPDLLQIDRIIAAHEYLKAMPKERLDPLLFMNTIQQKLTLVG